MKLHQLLYVTWQDITGKDEWSAEHPEPVLMKSIGFFVKEENGVLILAGDIDDSNGTIMYSRQIAIPTGVIKSQKQIRGGGK